MCHHFYFLRLMPPQYRYGILRVEKREYSMFMLRLNRCYALYHIVLEHPQTLPLGKAWVTLSKTRGGEVCITPSKILLFFLFCLVGLVLFVFFFFLLFLVFLLNKHHKIILSFPSFHHTSSSTILYPELIIRNRHKKQDIWQHEIIFLL